MLNMIKFYNQKPKNNRFGFCEIKKHLLQMLATDDYLVNFCDKKRFIVGNVYYDSVVLTDAKTRVDTEVPIDSLVRGIRLGVFTLKKINRRVAVCFWID